jgi:hypothetical protein
MKGAGSLTLLRVWLWGTGAIIAFLVIWMIAPVLFLVLLLTAGLGLISAVMVLLARKLEAWTGRGPDPQ